MIFYVKYELKLFAANIRGCKMAEDDPFYNFIQVLKRLLEKLLFVMTDLALI